MITRETNGKVQWPSLLSHTYKYHGNNQLHQPTPFTSVQQPTKKPTGYPLELSVSKVNSRV